MGIFLVVNTIIILNLVIAILAKTYESYSPYARGLYYDSIVRSIPRYKYDKRYTGLVMSFGPLSVIALTFFIPFYVFLSGDILVSFNQGVCYFFYTPWALLMTLVYIAINIVLVPCAYFAAIISKIRILVHKMRLELPLSSSQHDLFTFIVFGVPILIIQMLLDTKQFVTNLYSKKKSQKERLTYLNMHDFLAIESALD